MDTKKKWAWVGLMTLAGMLFSTAVWAQERKYDVEKAKQYAAQLKDKDPDVRERAAEMLGEMQAKEYAKDIAPLLKDKIADVRGSAAVALGLMEAKEYAKDVAPLVKDEDANVRANAARALGEMKAKEYAKDLGGLLNDKSKCKVFDETFDETKKDIIVSTTVADEAAKALTQMGWALKKNADGTYTVESEPKEQKK